MTDRPAPDDRQARLEGRWASLWAALGLEPPPGELDDLLARYREPHRSYHDGRHIEECLDWLDRARLLAEDPEAVALAIWYHDAIHRPRAGDDEEASAQLAKERLGAAGVPGPVVENVVALILHTRHAELPPPGDPALLVDIDLAILGAEPERYAEYERGIRQEYRWVPKVIFRSKRAAVLRGFLDRDRIYSTDFFRKQLEAKARANLTLAVTALL